MSATDSEVEDYERIQGLLEKVVSSYRDEEDQKWNADFSEGVEIDIENKNWEEEIWNYIFERAPADHKFTEGLADYLSARIMEDSNLEINGEMVICVVGA